MKTISDDSTVALVVHGGVIMAILEAYAKPCRSFYEYHLQNGDYFLCEFENELKIIKKGSDR